MTLLEEFIKTISNNNLIELDDRILIALSAGPDSVCLLNLLKAVSSEFRLELGIAHINYHLRGDESNKEALWIKKISSDLGIPLYIKDCPMKGKANLQAKARKIRYDFFSKLINNYNFNKVATGHHLDDQIETFFLRLMRGTSITGLRSMSYQSQNHSLKIIRPLLNVNKSQIMEYIKNNNLDYSIDSSNLKDNYTRNKLRLHLLPVLENIFPDYRNKIQKIIKHVNDDDKYLFSITKNEIKKIILSSSPTEKRISLIEFNKLPTTIQKRMLILLAKDICKDWNYFTTKVLDKILVQINDYTNHGSKVIYDKANLKILIEYSALVLTYSEIMLKTLDSSVVLNKNEIYTLIERDNKPIWTMELTEIDSNIKVDIIKNINNDNYHNNLNIFIDKDKINGNLVIRPLIQGDKIYLSKNTGLKKIKEILINSKIPKRFRREVLILCDNENPIGIISLPPHQLIRLSDKYYINEGTTKILKLFIASKIINY